MVSIRQACCKAHRHVHRPCQSCHPAIHTKPCRLDLPDAVVSAQEAVRSEMQLIGMSASVAAYHSHKFAVLVCGVVQPHTAVSVISFPEMQYIWLIVVLTALKSQHAILAVLHPLLRECNNLQRETGHLCTKTAANDNTPGCLLIVTCLLT